MTNPTSSTTERQNVAREQLDQALAQLVGQDEWLRWLDTRSKFHRYSFGNTLLIAFQRPEATQVAGYKAWQALGRQVRKGERGIAILAPVIRKDDEGERVVVGFRTVHVFDVAQTDGDALAEAPVRVLDTDSGLTDLSDSLIGHVLTEGLDLVREDIASGANGYIDRADRRIVVGTHLGRDAAIKTLIHELAHWHDLGTSADYQRADAEIVAESVAYIVASTYGLDTSDYSVGYVAAWADGDLDKVKALAERVDRTARTILAVLDADLATTEEALVAA